MGSGCTPARSRTGVILALSDRLGRAERRLPPLAAADARPGGADVPRRPLGSLRLGGLERRLVRRPHDPRLQPALPAAGRLARPGAARGDLRRRRGGRCSRRSRFARTASRAWLGAVWFGLGSTVSLYGGRITFALGLALGLAAILALQRRRPLLGGAARRVAAGLASPVAGLFTAIAAAAVLIASRLEPIAAPSRAALARAAWVVAIATAWPPSPSRSPSRPPAPAVHSASFLWVPIVCAVCFVVLPVGETTLRCGIVLYALLAILGLHGRDAVRRQRDPPRRRSSPDRCMALALYGRRPIVLLLLAAPLLWWQWTATIRDVAGGRGRSGDRGGLLRAAARRARERARRRADPGRDPADPEPLGVRLRRRALPARPRLAAPARVRRLRPVHRRRPDRARLRRSGCGRTASTTSPCPTPSSTTSPTTRRR